MSSGTLVRRPAVLLALGLCAFGGVVTLLGRLAGGPVVEQKRSAFTVETGAQAYPAFSPDGSRVAYSAQASGDAAFHVFVRPAAGGGSPRQLTSGSGSDIGPVWSPDGGTLAFLRIAEGRAQAILMPAGGGVDRKIAEFESAGEDNGPAIAWNKDGESLVVSAANDKKVPAIFILSVRTGAMRPITHPPDDSQGDVNPAMSPDGKTLAFVRRLDDDRADVLVTDLAGRNPRAATFDNHPIRGLTWSPGGQDLLYCSNRSTGWRLWRVPSYGGSPRDVVLAGNHTSYPAVAPKGYRLAVTDSPAVAAIWIARLDPTGEKTEERQLIRSTTRESGAAWSPDASRIANVSEQSGTPEIWVEDANGSNRVQLTRLEGPLVHHPQWSPDGSTILFETIGQRGNEVFTVPAAGGRVVRVVGDAGQASWSRDGQSIFYSAGGQVWRASKDGSNARQITRRFGSGSPVQSVDGKWVYYRSRRTIWRVPSEGGKEEEFLAPDRDIPWAPMQAAKTGLYYGEIDRGQRTMVIEFYDFASAKSHPVLRVHDAEFGEGFSVSPDAAWVLYPKTDRRQTNIAMIENFR